MLTLARACVMKAVPAMPAINLRNSLRVRLPRPLMYNSELCSETWEITHKGYDTRCHKIFPCCE